MSSGANTGLRPPWKKGQSGNPNGRPKSAKHQRKCRRLADEVLKQITARLKIPVGEEGAFPPWELRELLVVLADQGGYVTAKLETERAKVLVAALGLDKLSPEQKAAMVAALAGPAEEDSTPVLTEDPGREVRQAAESPEDTQREDK